MAEQNSDQELDVEIGGQKIRTKGYRLIDLIWLPVFLFTLYSSLMLYKQDATAAGDKKELAAAVKQQNAEFVQAIKENNTATVNALKDLTIEQRRSTSAIKEVACLNDPALKNRVDAREFCKRLTRDDR